MKLAASLFILIFALSPAPAQKTATLAQDSKIINAEQLLRDVRTLSADDMEGRKIGTKGGEKARAYIAERFAQSGVKAFQNDFIQPFDYASRGGVKTSGANVV